MIPRDPNSTTMEVLPLDHPTPVVEVSPNWPRSCWPIARWVHLLHIVRKNLRSGNLWKITATLHSTQVLAQEGSPGAIGRLFLKLPRPERQHDDLEEMRVELRLAGDQADLESCDQGLLHAPSQFAHQGDQHLLLERSRSFTFFLVPLNNLDSPGSVLNLISGRGLPHIDAANLSQTLSPHPHFHSVDVQ